MIEYYLKLIESFKEHKISELIQAINGRLLAALEAPIVINLPPPTTEIAKYVSQKLEKFKPFSPEVTKYIKEINAEGVPFTNFGTDPDSVWRIKTFLNALYYARLTFLDLENIDIRKWDRSLAHLQLVYSNTIQSAYQASYLLTHLDLDLNDIFGAEYQLIKPILTEYTQKLFEQAQPLVAPFKSNPASYTVGVISGIAINQMKTSNNEGDLDYEFITQFSALLPSYLEHFTNKIKEFSSNYIEDEPAINQEKLLELQNAGQHLLSEINQLKTNNVFLPLKFLNYIHIIRNVITLSITIFEQIKNLSNSTQDAIRDKLRLIKYTLLPQLFGLVDKIEDQLLLKPGILSKPLMKELNRLYDLIIYYASGPVDFDEKGEELLRIEDSKFINLRLEQTYKRIEAANKKTFKIKFIIQAFNKFFDVLDDYPNITVSQLPIDVKRKLIKYYKVLHPYFTQFDAALNNAIIDGLNNPQSWMSYVGKMVHTPADQIAPLLAKRDALYELLVKDKNSETFHIKLNNQLIHSVKNTDLSLFPFVQEPRAAGSKIDDVFILDEATAFKLGKRENWAWANLADGSIILDLANQANLDNISSDQALDLVEWYTRKSAKIMSARDTYDAFLDLLKKNGHPQAIIMNDEAKEQCRKLYYILQPYFVSSLKESEEVITFDKEFTHFITNKSKQTEFKAPLLEKNDQFFQEFFTEHDLRWKDRIEFFNTLATLTYTREQDTVVLVKDTNPRADFVIQHTRYSKFAHQFRNKVYLLTEHLNQPMQAQLKQKPGLPFPELEEELQPLAQPQQVLALKRIFNSLYHLEGIALELEKLQKVSSKATYTPQKLHNKYQKATYVSHLLAGYNHLNEIIHAIKQLAVDPHFSPLVEELTEHAREGLALFNQHTEPYTTDPIQVGNGEELAYNSIWYVLNAFYIAPQHIRQLRQLHHTSPKELSALQNEAKEMTQKIELVITNSHSYFRLFLQTSNMFALYNGLKAKFYEFIHTTHEAVSSNLDQFRSEIFTPMLLEADRYEAKLGLMPGVLSGPLKQITDTYFKGLINPMGLDSKTHITLVCDQAPFAQRRAPIQKQLNKAHAELNVQTKEAALFDSLLERISEYKHSCDAYYPDLTVADARKKLIAEYKLMLPRLVKMRQLIAITPSAEDVDRKLDQLLNAETNEYDPKFDHLFALVKAATYYYAGLKATQVMNTDTAEAQLNYLDELENKQLAEDALFVQQYAENSFTKQMETLCNSHVGLQYIHKQYSKELCAYLLLLKESIVKKSITTENIDQDIKQSLVEYTNTFEQQNFEEFHQLDATRAVLAQFITYFSTARIAIDDKKSVFESQRTLARKTALINHLVVVADEGFLSIAEHMKHIQNSQKPPQEKEDLIQQLKQYEQHQHLTIEQLIDRTKNSNPLKIEDEAQIKTLTALKESVQLSVPERLDYLREKTKYFDFKDTLLAHEYVHHSILIFLKKCILSLLEILHLYTPKHERLFNSLHESINNPTPISDLTTRYGLFAHAPEIKTYNASAPILVPNPTG